MSEEGILLKQIMDKGGLMGTLAKLIDGDAQKTKQFIRECYEQCHIQGSRDLWGDELTDRIIALHKNRE